VNIKKFTLVLYFYNVFLVFFFFKKYLVVVHLFLYFSCNFMVSTSLLYFFCYICRLIGRKFIKIVITSEAFYVFIFKIWYKASLVLMRKMNVIAKYLSSTWIIILFCFLFKHFVLNILFEFSFALDLVDFSFRVLELFLLILFFLYWVFWRMKGYRKVTS